ncbi:primosomal replication protein [Vibrio tapetis]|uniref:Putative Primosomal replication priB and priC n=1 Tax=Vibrio tapetis subsp. tapetis TaxID=1671868 RepID=A0A2N8ZAY3_9VIBR|nr:primosomal replication protein [Vibrio tapetis]SON49058.1 putative Primosomal replication priB and priC [Vibrio tapetis subsp. tapetis]
MSRLSSFEQHLNDLDLQAKKLDAQRGEHHKPLFDEQLFHGGSTLLSPCIDEARATFEALNKENLTKTRASFLAEHMVAQIAAITRELSTVSIRSNEIKHSSYYRKPINQLYQELSQHNEWERRLKLQVHNKQAEMEQAPAYLQRQIQNVLMTAEQRLARCQQAKVSLENRIHYRERNQ